MAMDGSSGSAGAGGEHGSALGESAYAAQLRRGFPWLRFEPALEATFRREHFFDSLRQLRINLLLALALIVALGAVDQFAMPPEAQRLASLSRMLVLIPGVLLCLGLSYLPSADRIYPRVLGALAPFAMVAIVVVDINASTRGSDLHFPTLVLATIFTYYLAGLMFYGAAGASLVAFVAYMVGASLAGVPHTEVTYNSIVLVFANLIGATVAYNLESARRTSWLEARLLSEMAQRDGLTGIYNRRRLDEHLALSWQQGARELRSMAVVLVDIDCFKAYNDRYGHQAGDEVLKAVAGVMSRAARRPLDFVARFGGEEFVVVLYDATRDYAADLAQRIHAGVAGLEWPNAGSTVAPVVTVSVGVAFALPTPGRSPEGLLQLADEALYAAKHAGRNRVQVLAAEYAHLRTGRFQLVAGGRAQ